MQIGFREIWAAEKRPAAGKAEFEKLVMKDPDSISFSESHRTKIAPFMDENFRRVCSGVKKWL